jgi:hypothetical protein
MGNRGWSFSKDSEFIQSFFAFTRKLSLVIHMIDRGHVPPPTGGFFHPEVESPREQDTSMFQTHLFHNAEDKERLLTLGDKNEEG